MVTGSESGYEDFGVSSISIEVLLSSRMSWISVSSGFDYGDSVDSDGFGLSSFSVFCESSYSGFSDFFSFSSVPISPANLPTSSSYYSSVSSSVVSAY